jgi:polyisoprenyl-teichoic acid--peptidoglycan teichoic acid transferase
VTATREPVAARPFPRKPPPPRHRRSWVDRLLIGLILVVALAILATGGGYLYLKWRFAQVEKVDLSVRDPNGVGVGLFPDVKGQPMNVLLVGSDTRANLTGSDAERHSVDENGNRVTGQRSDTIMILHADPEAEKGAILSLPRDLWVRIAGTGKSNRINTAFHGGGAEGAQRLIDTITDNFGIPIHHYVEVDFVGFRNLVDAVDGVPIYVPAPARDAYSDLSIPEAGCITLSGEQALAWVRSRHYQYYESGRWRTDLSSDIGRIARQQDFIRRLMNRSISKGIRNPVKLNRLIGIAVDNVTIDAAMTSKDIFTLGRQFRSLDPNDVAMLTMPAENTRIGGAAVLRLKQPEAQQTIDLFVGGAEANEDDGEVPDVPPNTVRVRTLNGAGVGGLAGRTAAALVEAGFQDAGVGNADRAAYEKTVIRYAPGREDQARLLRSYIASGATLQEDSTVRGVDAILVLGRDFTSVAEPGTEAPPPTAARAAPTTPTTPADEAAEPQC